MEPDTSPFEADVQWLFPLVMFKGEREGQEPCLRAYSIRVTPPCESDKPHDHVNWPLQGALSWPFRSAMAAPYPPSKFPDYASWEDKNKPFSFSNPTEPGISPLRNTKIPSGYHGITGTPLKHHRGMETPAKHQRYTSDTTPHRDTSNAPPRSIPENNGRTDTLR